MAVSDSWLLIFEGVVAAAAVGVVFFLLAVILGIARNRRLQHGLQMVLALEAISSEALQCAVVVVATAGNLAVAATAAATNPAILRFFAASCGGVLLSFHTDTLAVWVHGIWTCVLVPALRAWGMPLLEIGRIAFNTVVGANNAVRRAAKHALRAVVDTAFECMDLEELLRRATVGVQDLTLLLGDTVRIAGEALSGLANYADETPREHVDLAPLCARLRTTLVNAAPPLQCACPVAFTVVDIALTVATGDEACDLAAAAADVLLDAATTALRTLLLLRRPVVAPLRAATTRLVDASYAFACLATRSFVDTLLPEVPVVSAAATVAVVKEAFLAPVRTGALYAVAFAFWLADLAVHIDVVLDTRAEARMEAEAYLDPSDLVLRADELCGVPGRAAIAVMDAVYPARPEPLADCAAGASLLLGLPLLPPRLVVGAVSTAWTCAWEVVRAGSAGLRPAALEATVRTAMRAAVWDRLPAMGIAPLSLLQVVEEAMGVVRNRRDGVADLAIPWPPNARPGRTNWSPDSPVALAGAHAWMAFLHLAQYWTEAILHFVQVVASGFTNAPVHCMTLADDTALRTAALGSVESAAKAAIAAVVAYFPGDITVCATTFARALLPVVLAVADAVLPTVCPARGEVPFRMDGLTLSMVTTGARATVAAIACVATEMVAKSIAHNDDGYCYGGPLGTPRGYLANPPAELRPYNNLACYASTHKLRKVVVKDVLVVVGTSILVAPLEVLQELFPTSGGFAEAAGLKRAYERVVGAAASLLQGAARGAACAGSPSLSDGLCMGGALVAAAGLTVGDAVVEIGNTAAEAVLCVLAGDLPCAADEILILVQLVADLVFSIFNDMVMELLCTLLTAVFGEDLARFFMGIIELFVSGLCGVLSLLMTGVTAVVNGIVGVLNALCAGLNGVVGIFGARIECTVPSLQLSAITCPAPPGGSRTYCGGTPVSLEPIPATATVQVEKLNLDNLKSLATACNACRGADQPSCLYEVRVCAVAYASGNPSGAATCIDYGGCLARKTVTLLGVTSTGEGADTMVVIGANAWQAVLAKVSEGRGGRPPDEPWTW